jgi:hypothetical protein
MISPFLVADFLKWNNLLARNIPNRTKKIEIDSNYIAKYIVL